MALGHKTGGRKRGSKNKVPKLLGEAILEAAALAGNGNMVTYLHQQAVENPGPFLSLLGRMLLRQADEDEASGGIRITIRHLFENQGVTIEGEAHEVLTLKGNGHDNGSGD